MADIDPALAAKLALGEMKEETWEEEMVRPRGIFTDIDRQFLRGVKSYDNRASRSMRWTEIRSRVKNSILDLSYLTRVDDKNQSQIIDMLTEERSPGAIDSAFATFIEYLYLNYNSDPEWIEERVSQGITNAEYQMQDEDDRYHNSGAGSSPTVDVEIEVTRGYDVNKLENRLRSEHAHTLTPTEIGVLVREGRIDEEDIYELSSGKGGIPGSNDTREPSIFPDKKWVAEDTE